jgi:signal transduction histidine kinase
MGTMKRLLNKTLLYYTLFATIILSLSIPFLYWMMEKLYTNDVDEAILLRKKEFVTNNLQLLRITDIPIWNKFNRDIRILPDTVISKPKDTIIQEIFYDEMEPEWEPYRVLYTEVKIQRLPYILMVQLNLVESEDLIKTILKLYSGMLFSLLLVIFFITRFISNRLWEPFYDTLEKVKQFNIEQHSQPQFAATKIKEFEQLNASLSKLIESSLQSFASQKVFTQNAAHELQTPLAVFQSKLDLLLQDKSLTQPQSVILQSLYDAASRLSRINKNLLLLAKIENNQFTEINSFHLNELISESVPYFTEQAAQKELVIKQCIQSDIILHANQGLAEIMLNNLFLNAIRHNIEKGIIEIRVHDGQLEISNTGHSYALEAAGLFKRFGNSKTDAHSSGLGLAIVKEICDRHDWTVHYQFVTSCHIFSVSF